MALAWQTKSQVFVVCAEAKEARGESVHDLLMRGSGIRNEEYEFKFGIALSAS